MYLTALPTVSLVLVTRVILLNSDLLNSDICVCQISYSNDFGDMVVAVINGSNSVVLMLSVVLMISGDSNFVDM